MNLVLAMAGHAGRRRSWITAPLLVWPSVECCGLDVDVVSGISLSTRGRGTDQYRADPARAEYIIGSPLFEEATIHLGSVRDHHHAVSWRLAKPSVYISSPGGCALPISAGSSVNRAFVYRKL